MPLVTNKFLAFLNHNFCTRVLVLSANTKFVLFLFKLLIDLVLTMLLLQCIVVKLCFN